MARVKQLLVVLSCLALNSRFRELVDHNRSLAFSGHWTKRRELDSRLAHKLIESAEAFVFDLDGVIWIGGFLVEGVQETLEDLRGHGKSVIFATNNAMRTRSEVASRLKSLGLDWVMESDVFNSANAVARLLEARGISKDRSIYIVGEAGLRDEVQALGYRTQGGPDDAGKSLKDIPTALERIDPSSFGAVVCGLDQHLNYYKLALASSLVRNGVPLFASNDDLFGQLGPGKHQWPGAGSVLAAVAAAAGRRPPLADATAGKPSLEFAKLIEHSLDIPARKMVMVGDRLDTDIAFGNNAG
ncbi:unnamed protein product [Durusdinium trenchii]